MTYLRNIIGLFVVGVLLTFTVLPALAHGGAQATLTTIAQLWTRHEINSN